METANAPGLRRDVIAERMVLLALRLCHLLAQEMEGCERCVALLIGVKLHVVSGGIGWPESADAARLELFLGDDLRQQFLRVVEEFLRLRPDYWIVQNSGVTPAQFPRVEKR